MDAVEQGSYVLIGGKNHRIVEVDYVGGRVKCYWVARPKDVMWIKWEDNFEVIGWNPL